MQTRSNATMEKKLDTIMEKLCKLEGIPNQLDALATEVKTLKGALVEMNESLEFMEKEVEGVREAMNSKAEKEEVTSLKNKLSEIERSTLEKLDDFENRSRRKNLVFFGLPELDDRSCESLIKEDILHTLMGFSDIDIERAHRTPGGPRNPSQKRPRPIHVRFSRYSDREKVLRAASSKLKGKLYKGSKVFITDDVCRSVREARKALRQKLPEVKRGPDVNYAYIPWTVPACIIVVKADGARLKIDK